MLEKLFTGLTLAEQSVPNGLVVALGISIVFIGLVAIILICMLTSAILAPKKSDNTAKVVPVAPAASNSRVIENRQEIIAAVSAAVAEELGTDVSAIRIHSFKKL